MLHKTEALNHIRDALYALGDYYNDYDGSIEGLTSEIADLRRDLFKVEAGVKELPDRP